MEKIFWVRSEEYDGKIDDGLKEVNSFLEQGWKVKMISACSMGDAITSGQAYIVLEKE